MAVASSSIVDALVLEDLLDGGRNVLVLTGCQPRPLLDDGDLGTEAPVHLGELERDVAAADDDEMFRQRVQVEDSDVGHVVDVGEPRHVRHHGPAADVEEDLVGLQNLVVDADGVRIGETGMAADQRAACPCLRATTRRPRGRRS